MKLETIYSKEFNAFFEKQREELVEMMRKAYMKKYGTDKGYAFSITSFDIYTHLCFKCFDKIRKLERKIQKLEGTK